MARNFTSLKSLVWWIHIGSINIPYLGPVKTVGRINVFTLKLRDVLLTLSHSHLNQRIDLAIDDGRFLWLEPSLERLQRLLCCQVVLVEKGTKPPQKCDKRPWFSEGATKESSFNVGNDSLLAFLQGGFSFLINWGKKINSNKTKSNWLQIYYWVEIQLRQTKITYISTDIVKSDNYLPLN